MRDIAQHYGVGETVVHKRIHEYGIVLKGVGKGGHRKKTGKIFSPAHCANLAKAHVGLLAGNKHPKWKGGEIQVTCAYPPCGKSFQVVHARKGTAKYCCHSHRSLHLCQGEKHPCWRDDYDRTPKQCALSGCDNVFGPDDCANITIFQKRKFCSREHADLGGFRYQGEAHPRYKPNSRRRARRGKHGGWERRVKSRDQNTCQDCGAKDRPIHAHHIVSFADAPDLRWEISNGVTVCDECHWKRHGWNVSPAHIDTVSNGVRHRRWEGHCEWCDVFISKRWSDVTGKSHHFCSRSHAMKWLARKRWGTPENINLAAVNNEQSNGV
jgi:hypothetical protein